jgi:transcription factor TFIIIB component B''
MLGTNFLLMEKYFPGRIRAELKNKFKKEEKENPAKVDKCLSKPIPFDETRLMENSGKFFSDYYIIMSSSLN